MADTSGLAPCIPKYKIHDLLPAARRDKNALGYIPCDRHNESVARALEYAYDDWCTARLAGWPRLTAIISIPGRALCADATAGTVGGLLLILSALNTAPMITVREQRGSGVGLCLTM